MAFFKFRARGQQANEGRNASVAAAPAESVEVLRRRARHRLLGAGVLVLVGVIGFPLLFDTQPRPIAVDIPIEIPDRNKTKPLTVPATPAAPAVAATGTDNKPKPADTRVADASSRGMITETADGTEIPSDRPLADAAPRSSVAPAPAPAPAAAPTVRPPEAKPAVEPKPAPKPEVKSEPKPAPKPEVKVETPKPAATKPAATDDGARARALLEGKPVVAAPAAAAAKPAAGDDAGRFVIQVGAFADPEKAREVRQKLEKAGLKTYTNVAKTADGERTRVRVGPFSSRAEADRAAGRVKGLSLPASVLSL
ncbi:SPOR domain-containing protein [Variovorax ginsengisoli]|uniref:DedD protein n=1 Tax=Variovorax ginsengisoli TaxID=363844 RepID=A0ABT9S9N0_9BURK|nr:SPOR domain-containing protein [Variovorax ginsengisoli]MDP9900077.1 DedD protein [Variovorax ginsengisoli]